MKLITLNNFSFAIGLIALFSSFQSLAQYGPNDLVLSTQAQVDAFDPAVLEGKNLVVSGSNITNLDALGGLTDLNGLIIENNPILSSLTPLNNIDSVNGELRIVNNSALTNLDEFSSLTFAKRLIISGNSSLVSISGFNSLVAVEGTLPDLGTLEISGNQNLLSIGGFNAMPRGRNVLISNNVSLTTISGFTSMTNVSGVPRLPGNLYIRNNISLVNFDGFLALTYIEYIGVIGNTSLKNLHGFTNVTTTGLGGISISNNNSLEDLDALANLRRGTSGNVASFGVYLDRNPRLTKPCGIFGLVSQMTPLYTALARIHIEGSGFQIEQLLACGNSGIVLPPSPLVWLGFDESGGQAPKSAGSLTTSFNRSAGTPLSSVQRVKGAYAVDFGTIPGNYYVESVAPIEGLKNLNAFTVTGWVNSKSNVAGSGGNRIVSWINNGGDGVDLVYQSDGSLRLGVDGWPDFSPAVSSTAKVPTDPSGAYGNWIFFAVTYQSSGQVQFYFGGNSVQATLDVTRTYPTPGVTGSSIGKLAIGAFNDATRNSGTFDRMFRGSIDDIQIFDSSLSLEKIVAVQNNLGPFGEQIPPTAPDNLTITGYTSNTVTLGWSPATDNVLVAGYKISDNGVPIATVAAIVTSYTLSFDPQPGKAHVFQVTAFDATNNQTSSTIQYVEPSFTNPIVRLRLNEVSGSPISDGTASATFVRSSGSPVSSPNVPVDVGGANSLDFGTTPSNYFVESATVVDQLKNLSSFTLTGWVNNKSNIAGSGGNRIISWINNGGEGVDLVYQSNGSLRLGVDGWPDYSPAFSSPNKIPTNASAPASNWTFFAVTYSVTTGSDGQVQFYFGNNTTDAMLDVSIPYNGRGLTGSAIAKLAIGAFNDATRNASTWNRMFRGLIDDIQIHGSVLTPSAIVAVQRGLSPGSDSLPPSTPGSPFVTSRTSTSISLQWPSSTDNVAVSRYVISGNNTQYFANVVASESVSNYTVTGLTPGTVYTFTITAQDAQRNSSAPSNAVNATTLPAQSALVSLAFDEPNGVAPVNQGSLGSTFVRSDIYPFSTTDLPIPGVGTTCFGFAVSSGVYYVESSNVMDGLKNMSSFTLTGWVNASSSYPGGGGDRIISWINNGGDGVDLVYQADGSLRLGVDGWPDFSPAFSSPGKVKVAVGQPNTFSETWTFFAVTYQSNGQVQFYFGDLGTSASLDVTRTYATPGVTGSNIGKLAIGHFNSATRSTSTNDRMFEGYIDDIRVYGSVLSLNDILSIQGRATGGGSNARIAMSEPVAEEDSELKNELYQNYPNPYSGETEIGVSLVHSVRVARVTVNDLSGRALKNVVITERGKTNVRISGTDLNAGMYFYSLVVDGKVVDIKRMVLTN